MTLRSLKDHVVECSVLWRKSWKNSLSKKQIKGSLILYHSDVAVVNETLFFLERGEEEEEEVRSNWLWRLCPGSEGRVDFPCGPDALTDINTQAHSHIPGGVILE